MGIICVDHVLTSLQIAHFASGVAALRPWNINTEAAEHAQDLQKRCPQLKAYGLKTVSWEIGAENKIRIWNIIFSFPWNEMH